MSSIRSKKKMLRNLRHAIKKRNADQVRDVLRLRPKLQTREGGQMLWSVIMDHPEIATMLVRAGADLNERNSTDKSSFLLCVSSRADNDDYLNLALLMLEHGANVNFRTNTGDTALHLAVRNQSIPLVKALVERGLSVDITNVNLETAICIAARCSRAAQMLSLLVEQQPVDKRKRNKRILDAIQFLICSEIDESIAVRELLNLGVDINEKSDCGLTPLSLAVARGKSNLLDMLLEFGSDMNQLMKESKVPVIRASYMEQCLLMNLMFDQGASVNVCDAYGRNRLHIVCASSRFMPLRNIQLLLHLGADVNSFDIWGNTPFSLMDVESLNDSRQLYIKHLALLIWKGAVVSNNDIVIVRNDIKLNKFYEDCLEELQRMKETMMYNNFSMFDFFIKSVGKLSMLVRNSNFVATYNDKKLLFPMYFMDLENMFKIAVKISDVLHSTEDMIHNAINGVLPLHVVEKIAYYMWLDGLEKLQREFYFSLHAQTNVKELFNNDMVTS